MIVAIAVVVASAGLYWFQPWKLATSKTVNDAVPAVESSASTSGAVTPSSSAVAAATLVAHGDLVTHEHATSGKAQLVRLADGRYQLILQDLSTSDGPDLRVWLTDQPVVGGSQSWYDFDEGVYLELGRLKGNLGTQLYDVPAGTDVTGFRSVTIWCKRFAVSFGAAALVRV
ncbi:MAG: DM13 domain-containing protein [Betaproteobacteria bacterium]